MRYIKKVSEPDCFTNLTFSVSDKWKKFRNPCKKETRKYIIENEQNFLCGYCEAKIDLDNTHIEHIKPQSNNNDLRFDYNNFIVSCNGKECHIENNDKYDENDIH